MTFRFILSAAVVAAFSLSAVTADAAALIGYVDLQKAILKVEEGKAARAKLEKTLKAKQGQLTKKKESLEKLAKKLQNGSITAAERDKLNKQRTELQEVFVKEQQDLQKLERETLGKIMTKMRKVIDGIGKRGGYSLILEVQGNRLLYAQDQLDLTNEVIRAYNKRHGKKGK